MAVARPPLLQRDRAAGSKADNMEAILADVEAHRGNN